MDSQNPRFIRSPSPCALADEPAEYFRDAPIDSEEPTDFFREAPIDLDETADHFRDASIDPDEPAQYFCDASSLDSDKSAEFLGDAPNEPVEYFRLSALKESLVDVGQTAEYFYPNNPGVFDSIDYQIFAQVQPQTQREIDQWYDQAELPNVQSPFQPSRPLNALLQPIQTPVPLSNPQMVRMGFSEPQEVNMNTHSEEGPFLTNYEESIERRLMQAMIGVPNDLITYELQNQGQVQSPLLGCPNCWCLNCVCQI